MTAATAFSANAHEDECVLAKSVPFVRVFVCACTQTTAGDPSPGSHYKAVGILRSIPADR